MIVVRSSEAESAATGPSARRISPGVLVNRREPDPG